MAKGLAIIGLGVVGRRTMANAMAQDGLAISGAWDLDPAACDAAKAEHPDLRIAVDANELVADPRTDAVYIAVPPAWHKDYTLLAVEHGKAVFCEKPLGIDMAESRDLVDRVEASGLPNAVNFVHGATAAGSLIADRLKDGSVGTVAGVDIRLHFAQWPRAWQASADWLRFRDQGGYVREVLSHFVYLTERLFGPATLRGSIVRYPDDPKLCETHILAELDCGGVPISIAGGSGGAGPDVVEYVIHGEKTSFRLYDWFNLQQSDGGPWTELLTDVVDKRQDAFTRQLAALTAMLSGDPHSLPDVRAALSVQELIEGILRT